MSSYNRPVRGVLAAIGLICATLLPGCGFKPLYGVDSASHAPGAAAQFATIEIPVYGDRIGQQIRNILIDEMHPSGAAADYKYRLDVVTREADVSLGLQQNSTSTRGEIKLTSEYRLVDRASGKILIHETLRSSSGYNILVNQFGTELSSEGARADALQVIADQITQHLALYFKQQAT